jgi:hypothetical protein
MRRQLNKKERIGILVSAPIVLVFLFVFCTKSKDASPVLELKGYEFRGTNAGLIAKLKLKNTTYRTLWLFLSGTDYPLRPVFDRHPLVVEHPLVTLPASNNVYSLNVVEPFFMSAQPVRPSETLDLEYPMTAQEIPERVGLDFYTGNFADGNDFFENMIVHGSVQPAGLKQKLKSALIKLKRHFKAPRYHQVWCAETLTYQQKLASTSADRVK